MISSDNYGFAAELVKKLQILNCKAFTIGSKDSDDFHINFSNLESIEKNIAAIADKIDKLDGFIHLNPLDSFFSVKFNNDEINAAIKSFFLIIKTLYQQFSANDTIISSLSVNSVIFPYIKNDINIHPVFAGISGLLKTVHKELPSAVVKMVDFNYSKPVDNINEIIDTYLNELASDDTRVETGFDSFKKYIIRLVENSITPVESFIMPGATILITGGARGITFEIAKALVNTYKTNLIILGKSNINSIDQQLLSPSLSEKDIFNELKVSMKGAKPVEIKAQTENILKIKEILMNIKTLKSFGINVNYEAVDVTDYSSVKKVIDKYDNIDGIIHGAGIEESIFIPKKDITSFNRVFDTKVFGAINLCNALIGRNYSFFIAFSSVAAKFGNDAQTDYAAANDMLCKIIHKEKFENPQRAYKIINWTAWIGTGMANKETTIKVLTEKGIDFLPIETGVQFFMNEIQNTDTKEVIITAYNQEIDIDKIFAPKPLSCKDIPITNDFCFIDNVISKTEKHWEAVYNFSVNKDLYLNSHFYSGNQVVPATFASEVMIQNAKAIFPFMTFSSFVDYKMHYVIKLLKNQDKQVRIISDVVEQTDKSFVIASRIVSDVLNFKGEIIEKDKLHYEAKVVLSFIKPTEFSPNEYSKTDYGTFNNIHTADVKSFYHPTLLFMGEKMQTISKLIYLSEEMNIAEVKYSDLSILANSDNAAFSVDPIIFDACLQVAVLGLGIFHKHTGLPAYIGSVETLGTINKNESYYTVTFNKSKGFLTDKSYIADIILYDKSWEPVMFVKDFKGISSLEVENDLLTKIFNETIVYADDKQLTTLDKIQNSSYNSMSLRDPSCDKINSQSKIQNSKFPFLDKKLGQKEGEMVFSRILDINNDIFLLHHTKSDIPIFLAATGIEAMAEAASELTGRKANINQMSDFSIPYGIKILKGRAKEIFITASYDKDDKNKINTRIYSYFVNKDGIPMGDHTLHYKATFLIDNHSHEQKNSQILDNYEFKIQNSKLSYDGNIKELLYHPERLFMDGLFETIDDIKCFDNNILLTHFRNNNPQNFFTCRDNNFLIDITTIDGMFQTCGVIELLTTNHLVLPYEISKMTIHATTNPADEFLCLTKKLADKSEAVDYQIQLMDMNHKLLVNIEKMTMIKMYKLPEEFKISDKFLVSNNS